MLFVGIGGLWFIPTFHNITRLSPFLGALCVLSVLWVVNEAVNRKLMASDTLYERRMPRVLLYGSYQNILFVIGMLLALGVVKETGAIDALWHFMPEEAHQPWLLGSLAGVASSVLDNFATASSFIYLHPDTEMNNAYWKLIAFATAAGGNVLPIGSMAGLSLMQAEHTHLGWYFRNVGWKALVLGLVGFAILVVTV
jgi:Na+/H+ antiporter NhaD/arsenite permease-like protein